MISFINGTVADIYEDRIVVECNNIGYNIFSPATGRVQIGQQIKIHTYLSVREDAMQLYGFLTKDELKLFKMMLGVSGIGPKAANNILTALTVSQIYDAIVANDYKLIATAQGVGVKTAQRLIMELKDKIDVAKQFEQDFTTSNQTVSKDSINEAVEALTVLGYSQTEAVKAVKAAAALSGKTTDTGTLIKSALKQF